MEPDQASAKTTNKKLSKSKKKHPLRDTPIETRLYQIESRALRLLILYIQKIPTADKHRIWVKIN
jgi:hypothetical protein